MRPCRWCGAIEAIRFEAQQDKPYPKMTISIHVPNLAEPQRDENVPRGTIDNVPQEDGSNGTK